MSSKNQQPGGLAAYIQRLKTAQVPARPDRGFHPEQAPRLGFHPEMAVKQDAPGLGFPPGRAAMLNQQPDSVPVMAKPGEYFLPPDTVAAVGGPQALDALVSKTHTPSNAGAVVPPGFTPKLFFADGGLVEEENKPAPTRGFNPNWQAKQQSDAPNLGFPPRQYHDGPGGISAAPNPAAGINRDTQGAASPSAPRGYAGNSTGWGNDLTGRFDAATKQAENSKAALSSESAAPAPRSGFDESVERYARAVSTIRQSMIDSQAAPRPGFNEGLERSARANEIRQSMIDSQRGGVAAVGGFRSGNAELNQDQQALLRTITTPHRGAQNGQLTAAQINGARMILSDAQQSQNAQAIQQRGLDLQASNQQAQNALAAQRVGIEQSRFSLDQQGAQVQQTARDALTQAIQSGDPQAIAKATQIAAAQGINMPSRANLQTVKTDNGMMVFDPATGQMRPALDPSGRAVGGGGAAGKDLKEAQSKAMGYGMRAAESSHLIDEIGQNGAIQPSLLKRFAESVPLVGEGLGMAANQFASPEQQQVEQAQRDFVNAVLRQESGAAISQSEFDNARRQYFPQPGDSQAVIEQKRRNRETSIEAFRVAAGPAGQHVAPRAQREKLQAQQPAGYAAPAPALDFLQKNPQHAAAFKDKYGYLPEGF